MKPFRTLCHVSCGPNGAQRSISFLSFWTYVMSLNFTLWEFVNRKQKIVHSHGASNIKWSTFPCMHGVCYLLMCYVSVWVILGEFKCRPPIALYKLNKISIMNTHYCVAFGYIKRNFFLKLYVALEKKNRFFCLKNSTFLQECQLTIQFYPRLTPNHTLAEHPLKKATGN